MKSKIILFLLQFEEQLRILPKKQLAALLIVDMHGGIIKSHFQTSLSSISSKIAIWRTLLCYSPLACCFPLALLLPLGILLPLVNVYAANPGACCSLLGMLLSPGLPVPPVEGLQLGQSTSKQVAPAHHQFSFQKR
jgi:hypothetical protein